MSKRFLLSVSALLFLGLSPAIAGEFKLSSPDLEEGKVMKDEQVYNSYGCTGKNLSPALSWSGAPEGTRSFTITVFDPDAPTGAGWWHWVIANIPPKVTSLPKGTVKDNLPEGAIETQTDFGGVGYGGACPPPGDPHRYVFTVYALGVDKLDVTADSAPASVDKLAQEKALAKSVITVKYGR